MKTPLKYLLLLLIIAITAQTQAQTPDPDPSYTYIYYFGTLPDDQTIESCDYEPQAISLLSPESDDLKQYFLKNGHFVAPADCGEIDVYSTITKISEDDCQTVYREYYIAQNDCASNQIGSRTITVLAHDWPWDENPLNYEDYNACTPDDPALHIDDVPAYLASMSLGFTPPSCWTGTPNYNVYMGSEWTDGCVREGKRYIEVSNSCGSKIIFTQIVNLYRENVSVDVSTTVMTPIEYWGCTVDELPPPVTDINDFSKYGVIISTDCLSKTNLTITSEDSGSTTSDGYMLVDRTYHIDDHCHPEIVLTQTIKLAAYLWIDGRLKTKYYTEEPESVDSYLSLSYLKENGADIHYSCDESELEITMTNEKSIITNGIERGVIRTFEVTSSRDYVAPFSINEKWFKRNLEATEFSFETYDCSNSGVNDGELIIIPPETDELCGGETPEEAYKLELKYKDDEGNESTMYYPDDNHEDPFDITELPGGEYEFMVHPNCSELGPDGSYKIVYSDKFEITQYDNDVLIEPWISFSGTDVWCEMFGGHLLYVDAKKKRPDDTFFKTRYKNKEVWAKGIIRDKESGWSYNWNTTYGEFVSKCTESKPWWAPEWSINVNFEIHTGSAGYENLRDIVMLRLPRGNNAPLKSQVTLSATYETGDYNLERSYTRPAYFGFYNDSYDPNMISGPAGYGEDSIISTNDRIDYRIFFENSPDFATAAASRVTINCPLHDNADPKSVRLGQFGFGDFIYEVPDLSSHYNNRIDLSDSLGVWLDVTAGLDIDKNEVYWIFQSIDPETGVEPNDTIGFLPVNDTLTGNGEGFVSFSVTTFDDTETGDTITEWAKIVFDENDTVPTNTCTNMFDAVAPTSILWGDTTGVSSTYCLNFKALANDDEGGSGIEKIELYVNADKTEYELAGTMSRDSVSDTLRYTYKVGYASLYQFVCIATDNVGNTEAFKTSPEFEFVNNNPPTDIFLSNRYFDEDAEVGTLVGKITTMDDQHSDEFEYKLVEGEGDDDNDKFMVNNDRLNTKNYDFRCKDDDVYKVRIQSKDVNGDSIQKWFYLYANDVLTPEVTDIYEKLCFGETVLFGGEELSDEGIYYDTLATIHGCDSVLKLTIANYPAPVTTYFNEPNCDGEDFEYEDFVIPWDSIENNFIASWNRKNDTTLVFKMDVQNADGCSDTLWLNMLLHPKKYDSHDITICENGLPFRYGDSLFSEGGTKQVHFTSVDGCDSIVTVNLTVEPTYYNVQIKDTICDNEEYVIFNDTLTTPGLHFVVGKTNIHNCDSVVCVDLAVLPTASKVFGLNVCSSHLPMVYEGFSIPADTTSCTMYRYETAKNGCDSIVTLNLTVRDADTQITDFEGGWYWYSTYLDLDEINALQALEDSLGSRGSQIKSHSEGFDTYTPGFGWMGNLEEIENERMYMIQTTDSVDVDLFSCFTTGPEHPITIKKGWNWIGYVSQYSNSTVNALGSITPAEGDIIKSYDHGFAAYYDVLGGWFGSLTQMQPGVGYMYYSNNENDITLTYPEPTKDEGEQIKLLPTHWNTIAGKYPNNMTFIGKITIDNIPTTTDNLEVGVFCDGEVRGSGRAILMEGLGTYRLFVQVYGENGDDLTFKLYDHKLGCEHDAKSYQKLQFADNANYGSIHDPYPFKFYTGYVNPDNDDVQSGTVSDGDDMNEEGMSHELTLVPNPAKSSHRVLLYCDFTPEERDGLVVEVFNDLGVKIQQIEPTRYPVQLNEIEHAGNYLVRVTTGTGRTMSKKLVVTR